MPQVQMTFDVPVIVNEDLCIKGCHLCVDVCRLDALAIHPERAKAYMARDECWYCMPCEVDCPADDITVRIPYLLR